jgi:hypothetical protein
MIKTKVNLYQICTYQEQKSILQGRVILITENGLGLRLLSNNEYKFVKYRYIISCEDEQ